MNEAGPLLYVVYDHPLDFPEWYVCRIWIGSLPSHDVLMKSKTLEAIQIELTSRGLYNLGRHAQDDQRIAEVWI